MVAENNFMNWEDPGIAVVTGASSGLGATFSRILASQGFKPILIARRENRLKEIAEEIKKNYSIEAEVLVADLSDLTDIERVANYLKELDNIDVLINNAGFGTKGYFENTPFKPQIDMLFVHNVATVYLTRAVLPTMVEQGRGTIVFVSSVSAFTPNPQGVMYTATKAFLNGFAESLSLELIDTGVYVQALCSGYIMTEFHEKGDYEGHDRSVVPDKMWQSTEDVVNLSLEAFKENKVIYIPGEMYKNLINLYRDPKFGSKIRERNIKRYRIPRK
jgi:short-subunit dehydrogenase